MSLSVDGITEFEAEAAPPAEVVDETMEAAMADATTVEQRSPSPPVPNEAPTIDAALEDAPKREAALEVTEGLGNLGMRGEVNDQDDPPSPTPAPPKFTQIPAEEDAPDTPPKAPGEGAGDGQPPIPPDRPGGAEEPAPEEPGKPEESETPEAATSTPIEPTVEASQAQGADAKKESVVPDRLKNNEAHPSQYSIDGKVCRAAGSERAALRQIDEVRNTHFETEREKTNEETRLINNVHAKVNETMEEAGVYAKYRMPGHNFYHFYATPEDMATAVDEAFGEGMSLCREDGIHMVPTGDVTTDAVTLIRHTITDIAHKTVVSPEEREEEALQGADDDLTEADMNDRRQYALQRNAKRATHEALFGEHDKEFADRPAHPSERLPGIVDGGIYNVGGEEFAGLEHGFKELLTRDVAGRMGIAEYPSPNPDLEVLVSGIILEVGTRASSHTDHSYKDLIKEYMEEDDPWTSLWLSSAPGLTDEIIEEIPSDPSASEVTSYATQLYRGELFCADTFCATKYAKLLPFVPLPLTAEWQNEMLLSFLNEAWAKEVT